MKFFSDSKPPKTEEQKYNEWLGNHRLYEGKTIIVMAYRINKWNYVERLIEQGNELVAMSRDSWGSHGDTLVFKKPQKENLGA